MFLIFCIWQCEGHVVHTDSICFHIPLSLCAALSYSTEIMSLTKIIEVNFKCSLTNLRSGVDGSTPKKMKFSKNTLCQGRLQNPVDWMILGYCTKTRVSGCLWLNRKKKKHCWNIPLIFKKVTKFFQENRAWLNTDPQANHHRMLWKNAKDFLSFSSLTVLIQR